MLLPRSPQLEDYAHDFNKTRLVVLELWNAVSDGGDAALLDFAKEWGLPDHHHEARCEDLLETAFPTADLVHPGKRKPYLPLRAIPVVADDGSVRQISLSLRRFCQQELIDAFLTDKVEVLIGKCDYCGECFARRIKRGIRTDQHEFCQYTFDDRGRCVRANCRQSFHNADKKQRDEAGNLAAGPTGKQVTWVRPPNT